MTGLVIAFFAGVTVHAWGRIAFERWYERWVNSAPRVRHGEGR